MNVELERNEYKLRVLSLSNSWMECKAGDSLMIARLPMPIMKFFSSSQRWEKEHVTDLTYSNCTRIDHP